jgi:uncharacterized membrane-anchored protein
LLAAILAATYFTRISRVFLFWAAFVLTRPFGATLGDVLTKPTANGGLNLGTAGSSAVLAAILGCCSSRPRRGGEADFAIDPRAGAAFDPAA